VAALHRRRSRPGLPKEHSVKELLMAAAVLGLVMPAAAQQTTLSLDQIERKYRA
jgi:hypothetical protein